MQVYLSKQNSRKPAPDNMSNLSIITGVVIISASLTIMTIIPNFWSFFPGIVVILITVRYLYYTVNKKPLLLEISDNQINYVSDDSGELITISTEDILSINHRFCELEIYTNDTRVHNINLLNTGSEQTRWEIKEHLKKLIEGLNN